MCGCILSYDLKSIVPRQRLTQVVRLFFALQLSVIQPLFYSPSLSSSSRIFNLASHRFQFGFACAAFPFYFSSSLQLFGSFFIHNNTVKSCFQGNVLSSPKILYFFTVSGLFRNQISFCFRLFTRAKIPMARA